MSLKLHPTSDASDAKKAASQDKIDIAAGTRSATEAPAPTDELPSQAETLDYLMTLTIQLKKMAQGAGFRRLGLILLLAEQEARQQMLSTGSSPPPRLR